MRYRRGADSAISPEGVNLKLVPAEPGLPRRNHPREARLLLKKGLTGETWFPPRC